MYIIGIDIGTSSTKALALDASGKVLVSSQVPYPTMNSLPGVSEQDPEVIWSAFRKCILTIAETLNRSPEAIALSSAMHSVICLGDDNVPLSNLITWADNRSGSAAEKIKTSPIAPRLYEQTGTPIHAMSPLCKLVWLRDEKPDLFYQTKKFISIKEFVWFRLFGEYEVDYSIASATGLFNIITCSWHEDALAMASISATQLSKPVNTNYVRELTIDDTARGMKISQGTKFVIGGSDGCLANAGSFATEPGIAALTIGTSGAIRVAGTSPVVNFHYMPFNYRLDEKTFISGGPINNGGIALKWYGERLLKKTLSTLDDYADLLSGLDETPAGSGGLIFLPYILGERAPIWNSESCGVFFGITAQHSQEHFTRAVIEGIIFSLYQIARSLEDGGLEIKQIHVSGGFVRSTKWVQLLTDIFGKRVCLMNVDDASAIGAALIAMNTLGIPHTLQETAQRDVITFEPNLELHQLYKEKFFPLYEHLYRALILEMRIVHDTRKELTSDNE